ncbi:MAG TPA: MBL fold metallo-hydrolase [Gemmatimonadales bacterium]
MTAIPIACLVTIATLAFPRAALAAVLDQVAVQTGAAQERGFCRAESAGAGGYVVERIAGRLHCLSANGTMTVFLATDSGVVAVDAPPPLMEVYLPAVRSVIPAPVTHLIYSHSHLDHIGGASRMPPGAVRIAHEETARTLARRSDPGRPAPTRTFAVADTLRVGGDILVLRHHGPNHDVGQLLVYAPRERVLVGIDLWNGSAPWFRMGGGKDVPGYLALHDSLLAYDFDVFVGGHGAATGTRRDIERQREYLWDVVAAADSAVAAVNYAAGVAGVPPAAHPYEKLAKFYARQAADCARRVLAHWRGRLPGVEAATPSHCEAMLESRRVD